MKRFALALVLSSLSMVGHASSASGPKEPPFLITGDFVPSEKNPEGKDLVLTVTALKEMTPEEIVVNEGKCDSYQKIPANYTVEKGISFNLSFYAKNGLVCEPETVGVKINGEWWYVN